MSIETAQLFIQTGMLQELARLAGAEIGKASAVTDRNGHVWQYLNGRLTSTMVEDVEPYRCCLRCGQIEAVDDNDTWAVWTNGDGYCAEMIGDAQ